MRFISKNIWTVCLVAVFALLAMSGEASAQTVMNVAKDKGLATFKAVKTIIFIVGGFGLVGVAFGAIFGKINWKWFAGLAVGLAILAAAGSIVTYATGTGELNSSGDFGDSFSSAATQ
ncbi:MAG: hypothetical protein E7019_05035 [Alphaproteobacteria bacterium]|nr:hypothetical protein [Alphaproteobacteria bacterium]